MRARSRRRAVASIHFEIASSACLTASRTKLDGFSLANTFVHLWVGWALLASCAGWRLPVRLCDV